MDQNSLCIDFTKKYPRFWIFKWILLLVKENFWDVGGFWLVGGSQLIGKEKIWFWKYHNFSLFSCIRTTTTTCLRDRSHDDFQDFLVSTHLRPVGSIAFLTCCLFVVEVDNLGNYYNNNNVSESNDENNSYAFTFGGLRSWPFCSLSHLEKVEGTMKEVFLWKGSIGENLGSFSSKLGCCCCWYWWVWLLLFLWTVLNWMETIIRNN